MISIYQYPHKALTEVSTPFDIKNDKRGTKLPVCRVELNGKTWYGSKVDILGPSEMIYSPDKPRACGARLWIETNSEVVIHNKTTYKDMRK